MNSTSSRPNVIFVLTDDQGYGDLGCTGNPVVKTPFIDRFYQESVRLTNYHVGPTCSPTRAGLMTGHYANSTGVWHTIGGRSLLRKNEWTLASALNDNGYRTGLFGKWHLGDEYPYRPQDRGFEETVIHGGGGISQTPDCWGNDYFDDTYMKNGQAQSYKGYCTDVFFSEAIDFIAEHRHHPFFCYVSANAPHAPFNVDKRYADMYRGQVAENRACFYGMISNMDENFGRLRQCLQDWELEDNTILIFMTDNGTSGGAESDKNGFITAGFNAGLRGTKGSAYDGGHRVPFFIRWPGGELQHGLDVHELTANIDFMPTLLNLCGITVPQNRSFHGKSVKPLLKGDNIQWQERTLVTDSQRVPYPVKWRQSAVMTDGWRLINGEELYNMDQDHQQIHNIAAQHESVVQQLRESYEDWWELVSVQFDEMIPISIGAPEQKETMLTCMDWRNDDGSCPWHQGHIREGMESNGYWELLVEQDGMYDIELRRWPQTVGRPICSGIEGDDMEWNKECISPSNWHVYSGGNALSLTNARLLVGNNEFAKPILPDDECVSFTIPLGRGPTHLQSWFSDGKELTIGAYYVTVRSKV